MDHPDLPKSCQKCNTAFQAFAYYFLVNNERYGGALPLASGLYCSCAFPPSCEECHKISFGEPENSELYYLNGKYICESCKFKWFESASVAELLLV